MADSKTPVFITGTQRSGTTLLTQIFDKSNEVWCRNELYPIHRMLYRDDRNPKHQCAQLAKELQEFLKVEIDARFYPESTEGRVKLFTEAMDAVASQNNVSRWLLKDPAITHFLSDYRQHFEDSPIVIIIRDPRAVCRSYLFSKGFKVGRPVNWITAAERWTKEVHSQLAFATGDAEKTLLVKYEDLLTSFEPTTRKICAHLGIVLSDDMLHYYAGGSNLGIHAGNENVLRPPDPKIANVWRKQLTTRQLSIIESIAGHTMESLGYQPITCSRGPSAIVKATARIQDRLVREYRWQLYKLTGKH